MMQNAVAVNERWVLQWFCFIRLKCAGYGYFFANPNFLFTRLLPYTGNRVGYIHSTMQDADALELGVRFSISNDAQSRLDASMRFATEHGFGDAFRS